MAKKFLQLIAIFLCFILLFVTFSGCINEEKKPEEKNFSIIDKNSDQPSKLPDWEDGFYHDYKATTQLLNDYSTKYPEIVDVFSIGKSVNKKDIWCIKITNENNFNEKYSCLIDGCIHGCEWEAGEACLYLSEYLITNFGLNKTISNILNDSEIYIVPILNPDGRDDNERWNSNGIDLNRNFDVHFGRIQGCSLPIGKLFGRIKITHITLPKLLINLGFDKFFRCKVWTNSGKKPFSEPETNALKKLAEDLDNKRFSFYVNCHTALHGVSSIFEIDRKPEFVATNNEINVLKSSLKWIEENTEYMVGYPDVDISFAGAGWAHHWMFKEFRIPSYCFEMLSTDYEPGYEGGGPHNQLVHWMKTTLPVFMYLLFNIEKLYNWNTPDNQPALPEGVPPEPLD